MGAGNASTGGGGGVGPAGLVTKTGKTGTAKDAKKTQGRNELRTFIKNGGVTGAIIKGASKIFEPGNKVNKDFYENKVKPAGKTNLGYKDYLKARGAGTIDAYGNKIQQNDGGNNTPTVIKKNIGGSTIQTTAPTEAEVSQSETANADATALKVKKRGRSMTMMSGPKGVTRTSSDYSLGKKSLLGIV